MLQVADDFLDSYHEQEAITLAQARQLGREELVGRKVLLLDGKYPGYVQKYNKKTEVFTLRYHREGQELKRARALASACCAGVLERLLCSGTGLDASEDEVIEIAEEPESADEEGSDEDEDDASIGPFDG